MFRQLGPLLCARRLSFDEFRRLVEVKRGCSAGTSPQSTTPANSALSVVCLDDGTKMPCDQTIILDVRTPAEVAATGMVRGAVNLPLQNIEVLAPGTFTQAQWQEILQEQPPASAMNDPSSSTTTGGTSSSSSASFVPPPPMPDPSQHTLVFYCRSGVRCQMAAEAVERLGYKSIWRYPEGFLGWQRRIHQEGLEDEDLTTL